MLIQRVKVAEEAEENAVAVVLDVTVKEVIATEASAVITQDRGFTHQQSVTVLLLTENLARTSTKT